MKTIKNILIAAAIGGVVTGTVLLAAYVIIAALLALSRHIRIEDGLVFAVWFAMSVCVYRIRKELAGHRE